MKSGSILSWKLSQFGGGLWLQFCAIRRSQLSATNGQFYKERSRKKMTWPAGGYELPDPWGFTAGVGGETTGPTGQTRGPTYGDRASAGIAFLGLSCAPFQITLLGREGKKQTPSAGVTLVQPGGVGTFWNPQPCISLPSTLHIHAVFQGLCFSINRCLAALAMVRPLLLAAQPPLPHA